MHDLLLKNYRTLDRASIEKYALEIDLNMDKFKKALDAKTYQAQIDTDMKEAGKIGVRGAPASFVNGLFIRGAQPYDVFKQKVEAELNSKKK